MSFANSCMAVGGIVFDGIRRLFLNWHGFLAIIVKGRIMMAMVMMAMMFGLGFCDL